MIDSLADGFQYTILSMNGEPVVTPDAVEEAPADDTATAPATSDALIAVSALLAASAAGIVLVKKLRRA